MSDRTRKVKDVARLSGVTVRTLHHYDQIGLLRPARRSAAGHRLYSDDDLRRLQQILVYRELGLSLAEITAILRDPSFDLRRALLEQRAELVARVEHTQAMIRSIDAAVRSLRAEDTMDPRELFEGFDPRRYAAEVEQRWGDTNAYAVSAERTRRYSREDWARIQAETDGLMERVAIEHRRGTAPTDEVAMDLAEEHRLQIDRFFYPCCRAMHRGLGPMLSDDARFRSTIDRHGDGVAAFLAAAIEANCARAEPTG